MCAILLVCRDSVCLFSLNLGLKLVKQNNLPTEIGIRGKRLKEPGSCTNNVRDDDNWQHTKKQRENESSLRNLRYPIQSFKASLKQLKVEDHEHINHRELGSTRGWWWETNSVCMEWSETDFWFLILVLAEVRTSTCEWKLRHWLEKSDKDRRKEWEKFQLRFCMPPRRTHAFNIRHNISFECWSHFIVIPTFLSSASFDVTIMSKERRLGSGATRKIKCIVTAEEEKKLNFPLVISIFSRLRKLKKHGTHETHVLFGWRRWKLIRAPFSAVINSLQIPSVSTQIAAAAVPECCFGNVKHELNHHCKQTTHIVRHTWYGFGEIQCASFFLALLRSLEHWSPTADSQKPSCEEMGFNRSCWLVWWHLPFTYDTFFGPSLSCMWKSKVKSSGTWPALLFTVFTHSPTTSPPVPTQGGNGSSNSARLFFVYVMSMSSRQTTSDGKRMRVFISIFPARLTCTCRMYTHMRSKAGKSTKHHIKCVFSVFYTSARLWKCRFVWSIALHIFPRVAHSGILQCVVQWEKRWKIYFHKHKFFSLWIFVFLQLCSSFRVRVGNRETLWPPFVLYFFHRLNCSAACSRYVGCSFTFTHFQLSSFSRRHRCQKILRDFHLVAGEHSSSNQSFSWTIIYRWKGSIFIFHRFFTHFFFPPPTMPSMSEHNTQTTRCLRQA